MKIFYSKIFKMLIFKDSIKNKKYFVKPCFITSGFFIEQDLPVISECVIADNFTIIKHRNFETLVYLLTIEKDAKEILSKAVKRI